MTRCGYVAIIGRPNVGKSTLLNALLGQKISITTRKPQTTRHQILGIHTTESVQALYIDTPGLHRREPKAMNRYLNRAAATLIKDVDVAVFVVDRGHWSEDDDLVLARIKEAGVRTICVVNKVDRIADKAQLLTILQQIAERYPFEHIVPLSAEKGDNVSKLNELVNEALPENDFFYPEDQVTDRSIRFMVAEIIREKLTRRLGQELPYDLTVQIEKFEEHKGRTRIGALILVDRPGQKAIVIGKGGEGLKEIGRAARLEIEALMEQKVFLELWVKVKSGWADDERALRSLGYTDQYDR